MLFGPTGVGKTELISSLFSDHFEVISADSMQVYKYFNIGTAKPPKELVRQIPHHLIDIIEPQQSFSAGDFVQLVDQLCEEIIDRNKIPLISGGTAFYFRNFIYGLPPVPKSDENVRNQLKEELLQEGIEKLYNELLLVDPERAKQLPKSDVNRILRALEIFRVSGKPQSSYHIPSKERTKYNVCTIGLKRERAILYKRINDRVEKMFEEGLEAEIEELLQKGYTAQTPAMKGIGYREYFSYHKDPQAWKEEIKKNSRHYAKRQITFFSSLEHKVWVDPRDTSKIKQLKDNFLESLSL